LGLTGDRAIAEFLKKHRVVGVDTSVLIYWIEDHPIYAPMLAPFFSWIDHKTNAAVTSTVTMLEILVRPYRDANTDLVNQFYALLVTHPGIRWIELNLSIADQAARIRAEHNLRTPDAVQAATALQLNATGFLANDALLKRLHGLDVFILNDFAESTDTSARCIEKAPY
jgi:predicted nucleic acid-binding protein